MTNRYGVDVAYFTKELKALSDSLIDRTPEELERYLKRLADVAHSLKVCDYCKGVGWFANRNGCLSFICSHCAGKGKV